MGILDWFINRPAQFDPRDTSDELTMRAIDKAVVLTNPRLKLVRSYQQRLAPSVEASITYLREHIVALPPPITVSASLWSVDPALRAFFVGAADIPAAVGRSKNLRTLFAKYPALDEAFLILGMSLNEQRVLGMSLQGDVVQREVAQTVIGFSDHQARICGQEDMEVRRLLGTQAFEYLVAQALAQIGEERFERRELEDARALIRARLRLLQQQGPGLGSVFGSAPPGTGEQQKLEAALLENERQLEDCGSPQTALDDELECLCDVLAHPERFLKLETRRTRLNTLNVVVDEKCTDVAADIAFSLAHLMGEPPNRRAFVLARFARAELPEAKMNFDEAARFL